MHVELIKPPNDGGPWSARINGAEPVLLLDDAVQTDTDGNVSLSVILPVDSLSIGEKPAAAPPPAEQPKTAQVWGASGHPDPREKIPGWAPKVNVVMEPGAGDRLISEVRQQIQRSGGILA